ncbi:MAG TPA: TatD family hydrolase [Victivallales bacterium]|nr:TatD family hydrolase [Victivallales bacterium]
MSDFFDFHSHQTENIEEGISIFSLFPDEKISREIRGGTYFSCGIHPKFIPENKEIDRIFRILEERLNEEIFLAVGECGLDRLSKTPMPLQIEMLERQISIAEKFGKPLVIHCVRSYGELLAVKKNARERNVRFCIHGFSGHPKLAEQLIENGFILSFRQESFRTRKKTESLIAASDGIFFLESDGNLEGVRPVYMSASEILGIELEALKEKIMANALEIFPIRNNGTGKPVLKRV